MHPTEKAKLIAFYEAELARYGPQDPRSLHWVSAHTQRARFQTLYQVGPWDRVSVADIGSGLGDFYGFLQEQRHKVVVLDTRRGAAPVLSLVEGCCAPTSVAETYRERDAVIYAGYDLSAKMVAAARDKYPEGHFIVRDILEEGLEQPCDYVVASGTFNIRIADHERFFQEMIRAMYQGCLRAVAFNFLGPSQYAPWGESLYYGAHPEEVLAYCRTLCDHVVLTDCYLPSDYTIYMYKAPLPAAEAFTQGQAESGIL